MVQKSQNLLYSIVITQLNIKKQDADGADSSFFIRVYLLNPPHPRSIPTVLLRPDEWRKYTVNTAVCRTKPT